MNTKKISLEAIELAIPIADGACRSDIEVHGKQIKHDAQGPWYTTPTDQEDCETFYAALHYLLLRGLVIRDTDGNVNVCLEKWTGAAA